MQKTLAITLALLIAALSMPTGTADAPGAQTNAWSLVATPDGHEIVPGPVPAGQEECAGSAPDETYCTTMLHAATEVWSVALGASFGYTGTLEVRLFHATSVLVFQVHVIDGFPAGVHLYGQFPSSPAVFWHECFSYELAASGENPIPLPFEENGTPGGVGDWDCFVLYP